MRPDGRDGMGVEFHFSRRRLARSYDQRGGGDRFKTPGAGQFGTPKVDSGNINLNIDYPRRMLSM